MAFGAANDQNSTCAVGAGVFLPSHQHLYRYSSGPYGKRNNNRTLQHFSC